VSTGVTDPVSTHLAALARTLRGPAGLRRSMIAETRDGLRDAVAAHEDGGLGPAEAAARAVRDFGAVAEIAPLYQEELTARQGRRTALLLAVAYPGLMLGWGLLWKGGIGWTGPAVPLVSALARMQDVASWAVGLAALAAAGLGFRRRPPRGLVAAVAGIGAAGTVVCGGAAVVMIVGSGLTDSAVTDPVALIAYGISAAALVVTSCSVARTVRVLRA
jgi:hypothetical protein